MYDSNEFPDESDASREVMPLLVDAFPSVEPEPSVWAGIEARINGEPEPSESAAPASGSGNVVSLGRRWVGPLLAVAAVLIAVVATSLVVGGPDVSVAAFEPSDVRTLVDPATGSSVMVVETADDGTSIVTMNGVLPQLDTSQTYQLWSVVDGEVVSVGLLGSDPDVVSLRLEGEPAVLALTVEVAGGVAVSTQSPVAVWEA